MPIKFSKLSRDRMVGVHPDILAVVELAAAYATSKTDFMVVEGVRTHEQMCVNWGKGRTIPQCTNHGVNAKYARPLLDKVTWLSNPFLSTHRKHADGYSHAIDLAPWPLDWNNVERFKEMGHLVMRAAYDLGIPLVWGGDWKKKDYPHFELGKRK